MSVTDWTEAESDELDLLITVAFPDRPPLRRDPRLWVLFTEFRRDTALVCAGCGDPLYRKCDGPTPGARRLKGYGRCAACWAQHIRTLGESRRQRVASGSWTRMGRRNPNRDRALALAARGYTAQQIAAAVGVTDRTVWRWLAATESLEAAS